MGLVIYMKFMSTWGNQKLLRTKELRSHLKVQKSFKSTKGSRTTTAIVRLPGREILFDLETKVQFRKKKKRVAFTANEIFFDTCVVS
jgi:hypothetical protein